MMLVSPSSSSGVLKLLTSCSWKLRYCHKKIWMKLRMLKTRWRDGTIVKSSFSLQLYKLMFRNIFRMLMRKLQRLSNNKFKIILMKKSPILKFTSTKSLKSFKIRLWIKYKRFKISLIQKKLIKSSFKWLWKQKLKKLALLKENKISKT